MSKTAFITGVSGQDGAYLSRLLLDKGYSVYGGIRPNSDEDTLRLADVGAVDHVERVPFDLCDEDGINATLKALQPIEFYNLAAQSFVGQSWTIPLLTTDVNATGVTRILEGIRHQSPHTRFYQASTSEMFGLAKQVPQTEETPFNPRSPYGVAKLYGHWITINYRDSFGMHASSGILFNHESPLRGQQFVTRKISLAMARIKLGQQDVLELGNLSAERDWGYAADYVEGMWKMLQLEKPDDFVLATGETASVRSFVTAAANAMDIHIRWDGAGMDEVGIDDATGKVIVRVNPAFYRPVDADRMLGFAQKAWDKLGWKADLHIHKLAEMMTHTDHERISQGRLMF